MKQTKVKIATLLIAAFLLTFLTILYVFQYTMNSYIEKGAAQAIQQYSDATWKESWEYQFTPYFASGLYLEKDERSAYYITQFGDEPLMPYKNDLAKWLSINPIKYGELIHAKIAGRTYYLTMQPIANDPNYMLAVYVDVTAEQQLITNISFIILFIMMVCSLGASLAGIFIGKKIEQEQRQQKKIFENASHELKTPLMVIQGYADGLSCGAVKNQKEVAEIIMSETEKMASLIDEIMNLSRIDSKETVFTFEKVSLESILNNCLTTIEYLAEKKNLHIEAELCDTLVKADAAQLERAITNILSNALRYAHTAIKVSCNKDQIIIWNDGETVADEDLRNIFNRFYIGKKGNTGIGLSLTKEVIQMHGWEIDAENVMGGTQFTIKINRRF